MSEPNLSDYAAALADYAAALAKEYGTYRAVSPIRYGDALAYNAGDPVPASNVERHGYLADGLVEEVSAAQPSAQPSAVEVVPPSPRPAPSPSDPSTTSSPEGV